MKYIILAFAILSLANIIGCEGTGTGESPFSSKGHSPGTETVLAEGEFTVAAGTDAQTIGTVEVEDEGLLVGVLIWEGEPAQLAITLKHTGSDATADASGGSPLAATVNVSQDNVAAGTTWELSVTNPDGTEATVTYKIAFLKQ